MRLSMALFLIGSSVGLAGCSRTGRLHGLAHLCWWQRVWL